jgi:hypothetical protein
MVVDKGVGGNKKCPRMPAGIEGVPYIGGCWGCGLW